jgi:hypothetical protein
LDTCLVPVSFQPSADTTYTATLVIPYGDEQTLEVALVGNGYINSAPEEPNVLYEFALYDVYPNPFNSTTTITYGLGTPSPTRIMLYDLSGREVMTLVDGYYKAGIHTKTLKAGDLPSGLYFVRLKASDQVFTQKVMLIR